MSGTIELSTPTGNGNMAHNDDAEILAGIAAKLEHLEARRVELQAELDSVTPELRRYEKARAALLGEPMNGRRIREEADDDDKEAAPAGRGPYKKRRTIGISEDKLARFEAAIRQLAREQDDFSQVEIRARINEGSGVTAIAFEVLRQRNVIRLVRSEGNKKIYRLTREALAESTQA